MMRRASFRTGGARWVAALVVTTFVVTSAGRPGTAVEAAPSRVSEAFVATPASQSSGCSPVVGAGDFVLVGADGSTVTFTIYFGGPEARTARTASTPALTLSAPMVGGAAPVPHASGYWLVAADGGVFSFGDAVFYGSTGGMRLNQPIVGMAATADGLGYWLVAADGGVFSFGDAVFYGSAVTLRPRGIIGMQITCSGEGYWLISREGGAYSFGSDAGYFGCPVRAGPSPVVGVAPAPAGTFVTTQADGSGAWSDLCIPLEPLSPKAVPPTVAILNLNAFF